MSSLLRRAVTEAYSTGTNYAAESQAFDILNTNLNRLFALQDSLSERGTVTRDIALEAEVMTGQTGFVAAYEKAVSGQRIKRVALEGVIGSIFSAIGNAIKKVFEMIGRFFSWLFGGSKGGHSGGGGGGGQPIAKPAEVKKVNQAAGEVAKAAKKAQTALPNKVQVEKAINKAKAPAANHTPAPPPPPPKPAAAAKQEMSEAEKEAILLQLAEKVKAVILHHLKLKSVTDIMQNGYYSKEAVKFIRGIDFREFDKHIAEIVDQGESWLEKYLQKAKDLDAQLIPHVKGMSADDYFMNGKGKQHRAEFEAIKAFDKELRHELSVLSEKHNDKNITTELSQKLDAILEKQSSVHGHNTEADLDKLKIEEIVEMSNIAHFLEASRFHEVSVIIAASQGNIGSLEERIEKRWSEYTDLAEKQQQEDNSPVNSAVSSVYRAYLWHMNALHSYLRTYAMIVRFVNDFYIDGLHAVNAVIHVNEAMLDMAVQGAKLTGETPSQEMQAAMKAFNAIADEYRKLVKDLK